MNRANFDKAINALKKYKHLMPEIVAAFEAISEPNQQPADVTREGESDNLKRVECLCGQVPKWLGKYSVCINHDVRCENKKCFMYKLRFNISDWIKLMSRPAESQEAVELAEQVMKGWPFAASSIDYANTILSRSGAKP